MKMKEVKKSTSVKEAASESKSKVIHCSQCGKGFGSENVKAPYHTGFSHCKDHKGMKVVAEGKAKVKEGHQVVMHVNDDHEVSMAQGDLYELAKKSIALHSMLDKVDNLEGWVQAKITMAADYIGVVHDHLDSKLAMQGDIDGLQEPMMGEAITVKPTGATTSARTLPPQTKQMVQKVSQGLNKNQNQVMTDKNGNVSVVAKKDVPKAGQQGMMSVTEEDDAPATQYKSLNDVYPAGGTEIWYWKEDFARDAMMGAGWLEKKGLMPTEADLKSKYALIGKISEKNPEKVFMMMQGDMWSPKGQARNMIRASGTGHTSMSVGDIIKMGGKMFMADRFGFHEIGTQPQEESVRLRKNPGLAEASANMSDGVKKVLADVVNDRKDAYDVLSHPKDADEKAASKILQDMYDDIVIDNRLHPDDDFEQIIEIIVDRLSQDYDLEETSFADAGNIAGGIGGAALGALAGPEGAIAGGALGSAAGTAAGKWIDNKLGEDDEHVGDDNIVYQMRKVINLRGQYEVKFADGSKKAISPRLAAAALEKFNSMRLPADKLAFVRLAGKDLKSLMSAVGVQEEAAKRAKKIFGEDWGSSDTSAAIDYMKDVIRQSHGGKYNPETIEDAANAAAEMYYDQMGYDSPEEAAQSLMGHFVRRWMSGSLRAD